MGIFFIPQAAITPFIGLMMRVEKITVAHALLIHAALIVHQPPTDFAV
jgi:hypothetical protein